ncbi:MAG: replication-relaxation family protein [Paenibacillaceae bacterium]
MNMQMNCSASPLVRLDQAGSMTLAISLLSCSGLPRCPRLRYYHHLMLVDVLLKLERIKHKYPELQIDWRDNRYNSTKFELEGQLLRFKPDGDVMVNGQRLIIEMDMGTEFSEKLQEKFKGYSHYLRYLENQGKELPAAVLFICNKDTYTGMQRRFSLIANAFWNELGSFRNRFNLIGVTGGVGDRVDALIKSNQVTA